MAKLHPNIERERRIAKLYAEHDCFRNESEDFHDRANFAKRRAEDLVNQIETIEGEPLPPLEIKGDFVHRIQTAICPDCGLGDAHNHYECSAIPVPVVIYLPDVRKLLNPWTNSSIIPYQGGFHAVIRVDSVKPGTRQDAVREFGPESSWRQPNRLKDD